ncbi:hypothetical protein KFE94_14390 [bacterium SCSIO 12643]|nr:hypothetical protein KFE94_14390 [bacterium SCSIO 12643]
MKHVILFILILFGITAFSQSQQHIIGKWKVCTNAVFNPHETCETGSYVTYHFYEDGTFTDDRKLILNGKQQHYAGTWKYDGQTLIIDVDDKKNMKAPPVSYTIQWQDDNLFYSKDLEGKSQVIYTYFKRVQ